MPAPRCRTARDSTARAGCAPFSPGTARSSSRTFTEKLLAYALGRGLEPDDMPAVRRIVRDAASGGHRWSSIVGGASWPACRSALRRHPKGQAHDRVPQVDSPADGPAWPWRLARAAAARRHGAGAHRPGEDGGRAGAPLRRGLRAQRHGDGELPAGHRGRIVRADADAAGAGAIPVADDRAQRARLRPVARAGLAARTPRRPRATSPTSRRRPAKPGSTPASRSIRSWPTSSGAQTQLASLELAIENSDTAGACDVGFACAYTNTISWRSANTPLPMQHNPRAVFERLFGDAGSTDARARLSRLRQQRSVLDSVRQEIASLEPRARRRRIAASSPSTSTSVRDVERRIERAESQSDRELPVLDRPAGAPAGYEDHVKLMFDLEVLAYQLDLTRVITIMLGPRVQRHDLSADRRARRASPGHAPRARAREDRQGGEDQRLSRAALRLSAGAACARRRTATARCSITSR